VDPRVSLAGNIRIADPESGAFLPPGFWDGQKKILIIFGLKIL
jgi:hypothetical protein